MNAVIDQMVKWSIMKATKENVAKMIELKHGVKEALPYLPDNTGPIPCPSPQIIHSKLLESILHIIGLIGGNVGGVIGGYVTVAPIL